MVGKYDASHCEGECGGCDEPPPPDPDCDVCEDVPGSYVTRMRVTLSGFSAANGHTSSVNCCPPLDGAFELNRNSACIWTYVNLSFCTFNGTARRIDITVQVGNSGPSGPRVSCRIQIAGGLGASFDRLYQLLLGGDPGDLIDCLNLSASLTLLTDFIPGSNLNCNDGTVLVEGF